MTFLVVSYLVCIRCYFCKQKQCPPPALFCGNVYYLVIIIQLLLLLFSYYYYSVTKHYWRSVLQCMVVLTVSYASYQCVLVFCVSFSFLAISLILLSAIVMLSISCSWFILVYMSATDHEVAGSIPGTSTNFKSGLGLERGPPSLVRTIGQLLD